MQWQTKVKIAVIYFLVVFAAVVILAWLAVHALMKDMQGIDKSFDRYETEIHWRKI